MDTQKPAAKPTWKVSIIPKDAGNATDPTVASPQELESVIADPKSLQVPEPLPAVEAAPRYNANVPYTPEEIIYSQEDQELMALIRVAIKNGWTNYHRFANDATTIGMEAEAVIQGMRKQRMSVHKLMLDPEFRKAVASE